MTVLSRRAFDTATSINLSSEDAAKLLMDIPVRTFRDILNHFAPEETVRETLVSGMCANDAKRNKASVDKKVRDWLNGKYRPTDREDLFELCFILKFTADQADTFLSMTNGEGLHWRDPRELVYAYALRKRMGYCEAKELLKRSLPQENSTDMNDHTDSFTQLIKNEAANLETEAELRAYLVSAKGKMGVFHNRAYQYFCDLISLLEQPPAVSVDREETYTTRKVVDTYLDNRFPPGWDKKKLDERKRGILAGWPDEVSLSKIKNRKADIDRKTLILLFLATDGGELPEDEWDENSEWEDAEAEFDADADFRSSYMRLNQMLVTCGYRLLDPRCPFDWVAIYCLRAGSDSYAMEGLNERLSQMLDALFSGTDTE